ncbi:GNAT family N-acetyltransferase [Halalkalibacterium ligniniphilum]|uniref:GNAT family N-acetyltransferase n=1 Tax=Halalkalibacterium ligniniphilum TaxID=1134413 RepID=UPI00034AF3BD|nr:GNAT family N-acetyltransferase [Halalkalibacterium ligniniphilum]
MIRQLTIQDNEACMNLLKKQPAENLFIIGDIEAYGYKQDFQMLWGDFGEQGELRGVLLKYQGNYIPYAPGAFDAQGLALIISQDPNAAIISGLESVTAKVLPYVMTPLGKTRSLYYAKCNTAEKIEYDERTNLVKRASIHDVEKIIDLYKGVEEFSSTETVEDKKRNMEKGVSRTYFIEEDGDMISAASTAAENSFAAMIVGVCTHNDHRRKGFASQCMSKLCLDVLREGKSLCLFYDNPAAGRIYKRIGFEDIEKWTMTSCLSKEV